MAIEIFISYAHEDHAFLEELEKHLANLKRQDIISSWYDGDITPGAEWESEIMDRLTSAQMILLLISADFFQSVFCSSTEMKQAIDRHNAGEACVIPVLLRPTDWQGAPFDKLKMLPTDALKIGKTAAQPQAISGLGGIGKTQTAVEYAYRHRDDYQYVLWVKAETEGSINSDFVTIAHLLNLAEKQEQDQHKIVEAVKRWFQEHTNWLLILDNAEDLAMVQGFLPLESKGHILLTTRAHATGRIAQRIEVERMEPDEGVLFLLHRSTLLDSSALLEAAQVGDRTLAREIVKEMDGLPLALEQAGAYMEETACGPHVGCRDTCDCIERKEYNC